jgi:hypothetical protein
MRPVALLGFVFLFGCPEPDSVDLGGACKDPVECRDPANHCVTAVGRKMCTMVCTSERLCPDTYVCAKMDVTVTEPDGQVWTGESGYCLPDADVPPRAVTIRPKGEKKKRRKRKKKKK